MRRRYLLPITSPRADAWPFLAGALVIAVGWGLTARHLPLSAAEQAQWAWATLPAGALIPALKSEACQPPLFSEAISAWAALGATPAGARLAVGLIHAATCVWLLRLGRFCAEGRAHAHRWGWALGAATLIGLAASGLAWEVSPAALGGLFSAMALYYQARWLRTRRPEAAMAQHLGLLLALYADAQALWLWLGLALSFGATRWRLPAFFEVFRGRWIWNQLLLAAFWGPAGVLLAHQASHCPLLGASGAEWFWRAILMIAPLAVLAACSPYCKET